MQQTIDLPRAPIEKIGELVSKFAELESKANLVTPISSIDFLPPMSAASIRAVVIDQNPDRGDVYRDKQFCSDKERALTKVGILKIWRAAGGSVKESQRTDDHADPLFCVWRVSGELKELDGGVTAHTGTKTIDYRPGSTHIDGWSAARVKKAATQIDTYAETKAMLRMIRSALTLRQKYTVEELSKPFVIPVLVFRPDMSDPEIRRMWAAHQMGNSALLYGPPRGALPAATVIDVATGEEVEPLGEDEEIPPSVSVPFSCACPCKCGVEITQDQHTRTIARVGSPRCHDCFPSKSFAFAKHPVGALDLQIPKRPDLTVDSLQKWVAGAAA